MVIDHECPECKINYLSDKCHGCWRLIEYDRDMADFEDVMEGWVQLDPEELMEKLYLYGKHCSQE